MPPVYHYEARDDSGGIARGSDAAPCEEVVFEALQARGLTALSISAAAEHPSPLCRPISVTPWRVKRNHVAAFFRHFATMAEAGLPVPRCLDVLDQQVPSIRLIEVIRQLRARVDAGASLSGAMSEVPRVFDAPTVATVRAAEMTGNLPVALGGIAASMERDAVLRRRFIASLIHPALVATVSLAILLFVYVHIVPMIVRVWSDMGVREDQFPVPTIVVMRASYVLGALGWRALLLAPVAYFILSHSLRTRTGRRIWDRARLALPGIGPLALKAGLAKFARSFDTLARAGIPPAQVLPTAAAACGNTRIADSVEGVARRVARGETLADAMGEDPLFPPLMVQLVATGEESGQVCPMLVRVADAYDGDVKSAVLRLTRTLEPAIMLTLGFVIGFVAVSVFLPVFGLIHVFEQ